MTTRAEPPSQQETGTQKGTQKVQRMSLTNTTGTTIARVKQEQTTNTVLSCELDETRHQRPTENVKRHYFNFFQSFSSNTEEKQFRAWIFDRQRSLRARVLLLLFAVFGKCL